MRRVAGWGALIAGIAALGVFGVAPGFVEQSMNRVTGPVPPPAAARAAALHRRLVIADLHGDTLMWKRDLTAAADQGQIDLPRLQAGNVAVQIFSSVTKTPRNQNYDANGADTDNITALVVAQGQPVRTWGSLLERSLWHSAKLHAAAARDPRLRIIRTRGDLDAHLARRTPGGAVGAILSVEGLHNLEGRPANLARLDAAGFRMAGLTHFFDNDLSGSMHGIAKGGLTPRGRAVVAEMERRGMVVDVAHASHRAVADILAIARAPVVSSHGGVQATCRVNRNLTDDEIRGIAATGGVVGIGYWDAAVCDTSPEGIVRAIVHVATVAGIDHVGLGSDFDGAVTTRFDTARLDAITAALIAAGFSDADIAKVMGGNVVRVLRQVLPGERPDDAADRRP